MHILTYIKTFKTKFLILISILISFFVICIGTSNGSSNIGVLDIASIILHKTFSLPLLPNITEQDVSIIWFLRFPRVLLAFVTGASLAVSGAVVQSVLKNPLASPYTLGVSSGASLGVGLLMVSGISIPIVGGLTLPLVGFVCSLITILTVLNFSSKVDKTMSNNTIILSGIVFSLFFNAVLTILTSLFTDKLESIVFFQMGSFSTKGWSYFYAALPFFIFGTLFVLFYCKELDILTFGENQAKSMGVEITKVKKKAFLFVAILTGTAVATSGIIGFVDLIAPHMVRKIFGSKHIYVIPMSLILGGSLMVMTDLVSRTIISPSELPVGAVTALIGAPFFGYLYFKKSK